MGGVKTPKHDSTIEDATCLGTGELPLLGEMNLALKIGDIQCMTFNVVGSPLFSPTPPHNTYSHLPSPSGQGPFYDLKVPPHDRPMTTEEKAAKISRMAKAKLTRERNAAKKAAAAVGGGGGGRGRGRGRVGSAAGGVGGGAGRDVGGAGGGGVEGLGAREDDRLEAPADADDVDLDGEEDNDFIVRGYMGKNKGKKQVLWERGLWLPDMQQPQKQKTIDSLKSRHLPCLSDHLNVDFVLNNCADFKFEPHALQKEIQEIEIKAEVFKNEYKTSFETDLG